MIFEMSNYVSVKEASKKTHYCGFCERSKTSNFYPHFAHICRKSNRFKIDIRIAYVNSLLSVLISMAKDR